MSRVLGRFAAVIGLALALWSPGVAWAHALLLQSNPAPDAVLPNSPSLVHLWFSEDLNGSASQIVVWDRFRHPETVGHAFLVPGRPRQMEARLRPLPAGSYLVLWTSVSAEDGHLLRGSFVFSVRRRGLLPSLAGVALGGGAQTFPDTPTLISILAHWIELLSAVFALGVATFSSLVFRLSAGAVDDGAVDAERRLTRRWLAASLLVLMAASTLVLLLLAYQLAGDDWGATFSPSNLKSLFADQYSQLWIARQLIALLALVLTLTLPARPRQASAESFGTGAPAIAALVYLYALAASGHAASAHIGVTPEGHIFSLSIAVDWLHLVGDALWFGGQIAIVLVLIPALGLRRGGDRVHPFLQALDRFSPLAYLSIGFFIASGAFAAKVHIPSWYAFFHSAYGWALVTKMVFIGLMMLTSAVTVFLLRPFLRRTLASPGTTSANPSQLLGVLVKGLSINPILGACVLLATSVMFYYPVPPGLSPPGPGSYVVRAQGMTARVALSPDRAGLNRITVSLHDTAGKPITWATVAVLTTMLDMVMGTGTARLQQTRPGTYAGNTDLGMGGRWRLQLLIFQPSGLRRFHVDVRVGT